MKRLLLTLAALLILSGTAYAGELTARVSTPTCDKPRFSFRLDNSMNTYQRFTVVLWRGNADGSHLFLRDRVPAHGGMRGVVNPDWTRRSFYVVEIFRTWQWRPWNHEWRVTNWLAGSSARLECP